MSVSENKATPTPFKTMDIKQAFLAVGNRKRKASSPTTLKNQPKSLKLNSDKNEDELEIISEEKNVAIIGDCKENKDLNSLQSDPQINDISLNADTLNHEDKKAENVEVDKNSSRSSGDEGSSKASSEELNSTLNDSVNALRTSELSENIENQNKSEKDLNSSIDSKELTTESNPKKNKIENQKDVRPKKKRKMTPEEAVARATEREEKQKDRLLKKQELEAQKLEKQKEKERRQLEREMRQMEKEKEKLEKEEERKERERLKQEKKDQEEKERLQKIKEKEERKKQQQMMLEMKQEEKKKKDELRLKREEETKKAEEEKQKAKLEKEQKEKEKSEKAKAKFMKFFKKEDSSTPSTPQAVENEGVFKPFQVSDNMVLAHVVQPAAQERFNKSQLDQSLTLQDGKELYLHVLKSGCYKDVRQRKRLRKPRTCDADVIVVDKTEQEDLFFTAKLFQFSENVRPPYWGTWRKHSKKISPRNPFAQDDIFDYSVDSDEEWDEGGPGESLSGTENELESEDDYEVDNEFFVPHGYLSAEEENEEDEEVANDPEKQKAVLKKKLQEFESERKKKTTELKPIILGCYFENGSAEFQDNGLRTFLSTYSAEILFDTPIPTIFTVKKMQSDAKASSNVDSPSNGTPTSKKLKLVPEEAMPHLIRLLHGNTNSRETIIKEFQAFWQHHSQTVPQTNSLPQKTEASVEIGPNVQEQNNASDSTSISKRQLALTVKKISSYGKCPNPALKKCCWSVHEESRGKYGLLDIPIPNEWNYITSKDEAEASPVMKKDTASKKEVFKSPV